MTRILIVLAVAALGACETDQSPVQAESAGLSAGVAQGRTMILNPISGAAQAGTWAFDHGVVTYTWPSFSTAGSFMVPLPLEEGRRLLSATVAAQGNGSADMTVALNSRSPSGLLSIGVNAWTDVADVPAAWSDYYVEIADVTVANGEDYWIEILASQPGLSVGVVRVAYDTPGVAPTE